MGKTKYVYEAELDELIGADEFVRFVNNLAGFYRRTHDTDCASVFFKRAFLFSINDGDGFGRQMKILSNMHRELDDAYEFCYVDYQTLEKPTLDDAVDAEKVTIRDLVLQEIDTKMMVESSGFHILAVDIREWIEEVETPEFRAALARFRDSLKHQRVVFRIPAVDEATLLRVKEAIRWYMCVDEVYTAPVSLDGYMEYADRLCKKKDIIMTDEARNMFREVVSESRKDTMFWGFNTISILVDEMMFDSLRKHFGEFGIGDKDEPGEYDISEEDYEDYLIENDGYD